MALSIQFCAGQGMDFSERETYMSNAINTKFISFAKQEANRYPGLLADQQNKRMENSSGLVRLIQSETKGQNRIEDIKTDIVFGPDILAESIAHSSKPYQSHFSVHMEVAREFHLGKIDVEPYLEFSFEQRVQHVGVGIQLGISL